MKILLVSHGDLAENFVKSAEMIIGTIEDIYWVGLQPQEEIDEFENKIRALLEDAKQKNQEVFIVSDLFFGTPFNAVIRLCRDYKFEHITGINLALLLEIINGRNIMSSRELREHVMGLSNESIVDVNKFIEKNSI